VVTIVGLVGNVLLLLIFVRPHLIRHRSVLHIYLKVRSACILTDCRPSPPLTCSGSRTTWCTPTVSARASAIHHGRCTSTPRYSLHAHNKLQCSAGGFHGSGAVPAFHLRPPHAALHPVRPAGDPLNCRAFSIYPKVLCWAW
jgi:hypothetical protein